jgi:ABC-type glycerol-3-phosphate transport system substrate-binding protein
MKTFIRIGSLLLAMIMMLGILVACVDNTGPADDTTGNAVVEGGDDTTGANVDANGYLRDDLPDNLDYQATIKIHHWSDAHRLEFEIKEEELTGNLVEQSVWTRNTNTEERLGVKFEWTSAAGDYSHQASFISGVQNAYSGGTYYDIIASYSRTMGTMSAKNLLVDITGIDDSYIDLEKPWYSQNLVPKCSIGTSLFFVTGDVATNTLYMMYGIYYNLKILEDNHLDDPVDLVDDRKWTIAELQRLTKDLYVDRTGDGLTDDDQYGMTCSSLHNDVFFSSSGLMIIESDPEDLIKVSPDYTSTKLIDLVDNLGAWIATDDIFMIGDSNSDRLETNFKEGNSLFHVNRVFIAGAEHKNSFNGVEWDYGIVPVPLHDENQEKYYTLLSNPFTFWGIMNGCSDTSRASAVIECMSSEGFRHTTPAIFETNMKYRYTTGGTNVYAHMFDIIRDNITFDLGRIFSADLNYPIDDISTASYKGTSWASVAKSNNAVLGKRLERLIKSYEEFIYD